MGLVKTAARPDKNSTIYAWAEVKEFPSYPDGNGNLVQLPEQWRQVGIVVPLPTLARAEHIDRQGTVMRQSSSEDGKSKFTYPDYQLTRVEKYFTKGGFIKGWVGVEDDNGNEEAYDGEWLHQQFDAYPFLFVTFYNSWKDQVKKADEEAKKEEENFTGQ